MLRKTDFDADTGRLFMLQKADFDADTGRRLCCGKQTFMLTQADFLADFYLQAQADYLLVRTQALSVAKIDFDAETGQLFR